MELNKIIHGDCLQVLKKLSDNSVDCCVTSPPYFGLRDYGNVAQIGLEETPELFVEKMTAVFNEVYRVLKPNGTLWLNLGDSYSGSGKGIGDITADKWKQGTNKGSRSGNFKKVNTELKAKDLIGIPWMVAFALRSTGWYLRQDIIWHKPNPMPESVTDRCTKSHEYIFLMSKSSKYYYDQNSILQPVALSVVNDKRTYDDQYVAGRPDLGYPGNPNGGKGLLKRKGAESWNRSTFDAGKTGEMKTTRGGRKSGNKHRKPGVERGCPENTGSNVCSSVPWEGLKANKRSVWTVSTKPFKEAHFATFPQDLITDCIKAGCPENGIVLDPFMGGGTTALVARKLNRNFIGIELNEKYIAIANKRLRKELGMFG